MNKYIGYRSNHLFKFIHHLFGGFFCIKKEHGNLEEEIFLSNPKVNIEVIIFKDDKELLEIQDKFIEFLMVFLYKGILIEELY